MNTKTLIAITVLTMATALPANAGALTTVRTTVGAAHENLSVRPIITRPDAGVATRTATLAKLPQTVLMGKDQVAESLCYGPKAAQADESLCYGPKAQDDQALCAGSFFKGQGIQLTPSTDDPAALGMLASLLVILGLRLNGRKVRVNG